MRLLCQIPTLPVRLALLLSLIVGTANARIEDLGPVAVEGEISFSADVSGIGRIGDLIIIGADEGGSIQILRRLKPDRWSVLRTPIPLVTGNAEVDIEGIATLGRTVLVTGSHSRRYHRYFSHKTLTTSRPFQFVLAINSIGHLYSDHPFETGDGSRNNYFLTLITLGDGWHNNRHEFSSSAMQGIKWWQFDPTWRFIQCLDFLVLVSSLKRPQFGGRQI